MAILERIDRLFNGPKIRAEKARLDAIKAQPDDPYSYSSINVDKVDAETRLFMEQFVAFFRFAGVAVGTASLLGLGFYLIPR